MTNATSQISTQPIVKLATANMGLLLQFGSSPEVLSQATANVGQMLQQASGSAMQVMQSGAYLQLMQGLLKNYTEFLAESGRATMAMLSEGQAAFAQRAQDSAGAVLEAAASTGRRSAKAG